jgi:enterochelin esterase-like enzyme
MHSALPLVLLLIAGQSQAPIGAAPTEIQLAAAESRDWPIDAAAGEFVSLAIESAGIAVDAHVIMPDQTVMKRFAGPATGRLPISFVADAAGRYGIRLTGRGTSGTGRVTIRIVERRSLEQRITATAPPVKSPTIAALERELAASSSRDTTAFWKRVAERGTPIVDALPDNNDSVDVTFLWRGTPATKNVVVVGSFALPPGFRYNVMSRLGDTDVWFLTKRLPAGARFRYGFGIDGPLVFDGPLFAQQVANRQADSFNRARIGCGPNGTQHECLSAAELPGASPQPWMAASSTMPKGKVTSTRIKSERLKNERSITVYTPAGYDASTSEHDLLVLFDEGMYVSDIPLPTILDNLIGSNTIRPVVAILVGNVNRDRELVPNPDFAAFIEHELMPWVRASYRVSKDPRRAVLGGTSLGALAAAYVAMRVPAMFGNVVSLSGAFWWAPGANPGVPENASVEPAWLTAEYIRSPRLPLRFWMAAGTFETDPTGSGGAILETSRHLRDVLLAKGYQVDYVQFPGGHDVLSWRGLLPEALIALLKVP